MCAANAILHSTHHKRRARIRLSRAQETIFGVLLVVHALAHAIVGVWASAQFSSWAIVPLWEFTTVGFLLAGFGATGIRPLRSLWREMTVFAAFASTMLLFAVPAQVFAIGFGLNLGLGAFAANSHSALDYSQTQQHRYPRIRIAGTVMVMLFVTYAGLVIALRPWTTRWGTDSSEASAVLPGDREMVSPRYSIEHAIIIDAPPSAVWPWLVQMGYGRGGFYSYTQIENVFGARIANADRIVGEWQTLKQGDFIRAVPPDWMGGRFGNKIGWRVSEVVLGRALVLEGWGAFVLSPTARGTRLIIRTRSELRPKLSDVVLTPLSVFVFEPAHFIMQRRMLVGIKQRAERPLR